MPNVKTSSAVVKATPAAEPEVPRAGDDDAIIIPTPIAGLSLTFTRDQRQLTSDQLRILGPLGIDATYDVGEVIVWLVSSAKRGFDPWARETYLYKVGGKYVHHVGIEALRGKAEATGQYEGQTPPQYCGPDGVWVEVWTKQAPPLACRVGVYRHGFRDAVYKPVYWEEYCPLIDESVWEDDGRGGRRKRRTGELVPAPMWRAGARGGRRLWMLQKCGEAASLRATWPDRFNGFYIPEETEKSRRDDDREKEAAADAAAERRAAAYAAAHEGKPPPVVTPTDIDGEAVVVREDPDDPDLLDGDRLRDLALTELAMQAQILGRSVEWVTGRWVAARGGREWETATPQEIADMVRAARPYVIDALRRAGRDAHADAYERAGTQILPVDQLLDDDGETGGGDAPPVAGADVAATGTVTAGGER